MKSRDRIKRQYAFLLGYISGFGLSLIILTNVPLITLWIQSKVSYRCEQAASLTSKTNKENALQLYMKTVYFHTKNMKCSGILKNNSEEISNGHTYLKRFNYTFQSFSEKLFLEVAQDCDLFSNLLGYRKNSTKYEASLPLAYTILTHENIEQLERLLRTIYLPQNIYCIHVDLKSPTSFVRAAQFLSDCFPNVFLTSRRVNVIYAHFSRLRAELNCIEDLLKTDRSWKYYINMASTELPLKTNAETVEKLKTLNGSNDIEEMFKYKLPARYEFRYEVVGQAVKRTRQRLPLPPYNLTLTKGVAYGIFSRKFLEFVLTNKIAKEFLRWSKATYSPDEHYWATLNNLHHNHFLGSPGGSKVHPDKTRYISRFIKWKGRQKCHGRYRHNICVFGLGDLPSLLQQKKLVANKFDLRYDPIAYACMEEILRNRTYHQSKMSSI